VQFASAMSQVTCRQQLHERANTVNTNVDNPILPRVFTSTSKKANHVHMRAKKSAPHAAERFEPTETGRWIRRVRVALGKTQAEFAEMIGAGSTAVQKWESGERQNVNNGAVSRALAIAPTALRGECPLLGTEPTPPVVSDSPGKVAPATDQGELYARGEAHMRAELERLRPTLNEDVYGLLLNDITNLRGLGPANPEAARQVLMVMLGLYSAGASRSGKSR